MSNRRIFAGLCVALCLSLASACGPEELTEEEKRSIAEVDCVIDDSYGFDTAVDITAGVVVTGTICPAGFDDRDYYRITTGPDDRIMELHLFNQTAYTNLDLRAALLYPDGTPTPHAFTAAGAAGTVTDDRAAFRVEPGSVYLIEVSDEAGDDGDPANPYSLEVVLASQPDSAEDNDSAALASAAACGGQADGYLATRGDQDYFRCSAPARPARLKLLFEAAADLGWQPHVVVLNDLGQQMLDVELVPGADGSYRYLGAVGLTEYVADPASPARAETLSLAGDFVVRIEDSATEGDAIAGYNFDPTTGRYRLTLEVDDGPAGDSEPAARNDAPGAATSLGSSQTISGYFAAAGDVDWYRVDGQSGNNVLEIELQLPADGHVSDEVDPDRVGVDLMVYDARLLADGGGSTSVTTGCTENATFAHELLPCDNFNPSADSCRDAHGEQNPVCLPGAFCGELRHSKLILQGADASRTPQAASYRTAIAVRKGQPVFIKVAQFQSAVFHEAQPYTLRVNRRADPDGDEPNDLPPALNFQARYSSASGAIRSCNRNAFSARHIGSASSCGGSFSASGVLSYLGDRDYFTFNLPPGEVAVNIDVSASGVSSTPVELGVFVFTGGSRLHGSFVDSSSVRASVDQACSGDADCCLGSLYECDYDERPCEGGQCSASRECVAHTECPDDHLCVAEKCFRDDQAHSPPSLTFGPDGGNCLMARPCSDGNPWMIEVTDNGLNDYDVEMRYNLTVRHSCSCPDRCSFCGAPDDYRACTDYTRQ